MLILAFGWQAVFYVGAIAPALVATVMLIALPDSLQFLVLRGKTPARVRGWFNRIDPSLRLQANTEFVVRERSKQGLPSSICFATAWPRARCCCG